jgi:hypothetical protein
MPGSPPGASKRLADSMDLRDAHYGQKRESCGDGTALTYLRSGERGGSQSVLTAEALSRAANSPRASSSF